MFRRGRRPLRPNWWTILPLLANTALWVGIIYVGVRAKSMLDDKAATAIYAASDEAETSSRRQSGPSDCPQPGCAVEMEPAAAAIPTR